MKHRYYTTLIFLFVTLLLSTPLHSEDKVVLVEDFVKAFSVTDEELDRLISIEAQPKVAITIHFETDSAEIKGDYNAAQLEQLGRALKTPALASRVFSVEGHTDQRGSAPYNLKLSQRRSQAVADYLVGTHGVNPRQLQVNGQGEYFPLDESNTDQAHAKNRRVEIVLDGRVE